MVAAGVINPWQPVHIMHKNVMRPSPNIAVMAAKPPKPPCWRDFVSDAKFPSQSITDSEFTDISKIARSSNDSYSSDGQINNKTGKPKRLRAKIHRTRSQFTIEESDLPEETLTVTLAETKPDDLGLHRQSAFDERIFQEDNNRKCQSWLQNIEACKPLEDVACFELCEPEVEGVSIEVPDDTTWYESSILSNTNVGPETSVQLLDMQFKPLHRTKTYGTTQVKVTNSKGRRSIESKHVPVFKGDTHINTG